MTVTYQTTEHDETLRNVVLIVPSADGRLLYCTLNGSNGAGNTIVVGAQQLKMIQEG